MMDYLAHSLSKGRQLLLAVPEGVGLLVWKRTLNKALGHGVTNSRSVSHQQIECYFGLWGIPKGTRRGAKGRRFFNNSKFSSLATLRNQPVAGFARSQLLGCIFRTTTLRERKKPC
jgi:hypothetical protein